MNGLLVAARDRDRLTQILAVASRFGIGVLLARIGLEAGGCGFAEDSLPARTLPRRTREALEELGPVFVKLGQVLATRADLLGPEWIAELERLHSNVAALPFETLRPAVEAALGMAPEQAFVAFEPEPLAAASMAQVHRATTADGRDVVLKIRRPRIRPRIEADLRLLAWLAERAEETSAPARRLRAVAMVRALAAALTEELDFANEGRNADRIREDFAGDPRIVVPAIHWAWSSETLLVMDHVVGVAPGDRATLVAAGIDPAAIAATGADMVLDMVLFNGRFHADPHPGNLLCLPGNRLALLDFGSVGQVSPRRQDEFVAFARAIRGRDAALLAEVLAAWSEAPVSTLRRPAEDLVSRHGGTRLLMAPLVRDFLALMRESSLALPPDLLMMFKALLTMDGVLAGIEPDFDLSAAMGRALLRIGQARLSPMRWAMTAQALAWEVARLGDDAPQLMRAAIARLEAPPAGHWDANPALVGAIRWLSAAILAAGALVGAAIVLR